MSALDLLYGDDAISPDSAPPPQSQSAPPAAPAPQAQPVRDGGPMPTPHVESIANLGGNAPQPVSPAAAAPPSSSRWRSVVSGVLSGLLTEAKGVGQGLALGGIPGAIEGGISPSTAQHAWEARQQFGDDRLKTADAQTAIAMSHAAVAKAQLENLSDEVKNAVDDHGMKVAAFWAKQNFEPALVTDNSPEAAYAGLRQLARMNGGQVPMHTEVRLAGRLIFYTPKAGAGTDDASLRVTNNLRSVEGLPPIRPEDWTNPKFNRQQASADAASLLAPNGDQLTPAKISGEIARRQIVRANYYAKAPDTETGKAENLKQLDSTIEMMKQVQAGELKNSLETKRAEENIKAGAQAAAAGRVQSRQEQAETNRRYDAFTKSHIPSLEKSDQTYSQFKTILDDASAGKMTGAESVVGLFNAIGISATPLKGMGFRINNSTVEEHADAIGAQSKLYRSLLNLKSGDVVTPQQIQDYAKLAVGARHDLYMSSVDEAQRQNLPLDFLPKGRGRQLDKDTAQIYADAFGDKNQARAAAKSAGWRF